MEESGSREGSVSTSAAYIPISGSIFFFFYHRKAKYGFTLYIDSPKRPVHHATLVKMAPLTSSLRHVKKRCRWYRGLRNPFHCLYGLLWWKLYCHERVCGLGKGTVRYINALEATDAPKTISRNGSSILIQCVSWRSSRKLVISILLINFAASTLELFCCLIFHVTW